MGFMKKLLLCCFMVMAMSIMWSIPVLADGVGDTGDTDQGNTGGTNVYTFSYIYDAGADAIELKVTTLRPLSSFGNTTSHTFTSPSDQTVLNTQNPRLGNSLENAIATMNANGGYNLSVSDAKAALNELGYYDSGNGIWRREGGYLTYVSAVKIRPKIHTVHYNANGGSGAPADQKKTEGQQLSLPNKKPTRVGYTFKYWIASIGGDYNPGQKYTHDQDGGTVTMKANWKDETAPSSGDFVATPNQWSAENGTVTFNAQDQGTGLSSIVLERYSYVTRTWSTIKTWSYNGTTSRVSGSYTEYSEGVFYYKLTITDKAGNTTTKTSATIYLDHSSSVLSGVQNTNTDWTNVAPVISVTATDYLSGTTYSGSGLTSVVIKDDTGTVVASGTASAQYTVAAKYEGIHTWYIIATDNVGHTSSSQVTTKYDVTSPGLDGNEVTEVINGVTVSGYCQDNTIRQHIDDEATRSVNSPNVTSGIRSVILYRVSGGNRTVIYSDSTKIVFNISNTHSYFDMQYEINADEKGASYYEIIVVDFAGNRTTKKLTSQYSLLSWFHTSINRSSYK
ncbi:MAG: InlB B-repeat-containing protein [bacterium]|nr:InlB B-repeat-containing protein [bacterium]